MQGATAMHLYDLGVKLLELGAIQAYDMSIESTVTKLMWALKRADGVDGVREIMHTDYCGEISVPGEPCDRYFRSGLGPSLRMRSVICSAAFANAWA